MVQLGKIVMLLLITPSLFALDDVQAIAHLRAYKNSGIAKDGRIGLLESHWDTPESGSLAAIVQGLRLGALPANRLYAPTRLLSLAIYEESRSGIGRIQAIRVGVWQKQGEYQSIQLILLSGLARHLVTLLFDEARVELVGLLVELGER
jgi:hypothetical protein